MSEIMVKGESEGWYQADICEIELTVCTEGKTTAEASKSCMDQCEALVEKLRDLGLRPEEIELSRDSLERERHYGDDELLFESTRSITFCTDAKVKNVNALRYVIQEGFANVLLSTRYRLSNESEIKKQLLNEAIAASRAKAELLAESIGREISGVKEANLSGWESVEDASKYDPDLVMRAARCAKATDSIIDELQPGKVSLSADIRVVWIAI